MADTQLPSDGAELVAPEHTALVIWDMQHGIAGRAHNLPTLRTRLESLLTAARRSGVTVVWSRHVAPPLAYTAPSAIRTLMKRQGVTRASELTPYMQQGSAETGLLDGLEPTDDELVIEKSTPSLFIGTAVETRLRARGVQTLILAGVATEQGIEFTARHALALGFFVVVAEDAVGSFSPEAHELGLTFLRTVADLHDVAKVARHWG